MKIKPPAVAGKFYANDKDELLSQLDFFAESSTNDYDFRSRAIIVPHAGYYYSGQLAYEGFRHLNKNAKNVFIIAPTHYVPFEGLALSNYDQWSTPLGEIELNQKINDELIARFYYCSRLDEAFASEHSAEVQVPFIQKMLPDAKIVPILVGKIDYRLISRIIEFYWADPENVFVISSDLSHFCQSDEARKLDSITAKMIETGDLEKFNLEQACGFGGVCALTHFAKTKSFSMLRVGMYNSGDVTGDTSRVVGYGCWALYPGTKTQFLKQNFSELLVEICKKSIKAGLKNKELELDYATLPAVLNEFGACFVTLERQGSLRGCIGTIVAHQPLIVDLVKNAKNSAFSDPRFMPLTEDEFDDLSIAISLLSAPVQMKFKDEADLLEQIVQDKDGIIIKDGRYQAVYLPSVWEQLPDKTLFLNSLKEKAGLPANHFSKTFEAYRFSAEYVK